MTTISSLGTKMRGAMVVWLSRFPVDAFIQILEMAERFLVFLLSVSLDVTDVLRVLHILCEFLHLPPPETANLTGITPTHTHTHKNQMMQTKRDPS